MKSPPLIPWPLLLLTALAILAAILCTAGCATEGYWRASHAPILVRGIVEMARPGGRDDLLGNANYATGMIEIKTGLTGYLRECVISHERHHFEGFTHIERKGFATDCGDGSMAHF